MPEVGFDDVTRERVERGRRHRSLDWAHVVVAPHDREPDRIVVWGLEESALECPGEIFLTIPGGGARGFLCLGLWIEEVPVEDEGVDAVGIGRLDLPGHDGGIVLVFVAPSGNLGLEVPLELRLRRLDEPPLRRRHGAPVGEVVDGRLHAVAFAAECGGEHTEREAHACQAPAFDQLPK